MRSTGYAASGFGRDEINTAGLDNRNSLSLRHIVRAVILGVRAFQRSRMLALMFPCFQMQASPVAGSATQYRPGSVN